MTAPRRALLLWGIKAQLRELAELCSELAAAALRLAMDETTIHRGALCNRLAAVEIMLEVMREHYGGLEIDRHRARELVRLEKRLNEAKAAAATVQPPVAAPRPDDGTTEDDPLLTLAAAANLTDGRRSPRSLYQAAAHGSLLVEREGRSIRVRRSVVLEYDRNARRRG